MIDNIGMNDKLTISVVRDGEIVKQMTPISDSGFIGKVMSALGLKSYTTDLVTTAGIQSLTTYIDSTYTHVAFGTGTTAPTRADTALETEVDRVAATVTITTTSLTNDTVNFVAEFAITGTHAITEAGILSAGGILLARQTFDVITLVNGDTLILDWDVALA